MTTSAGVADDGRRVASRQRLFAVLARGRETQLAGLGLLVVASSLLPLAGPQLLRVFIDNAVAGRPLSFLVFVACVYIGVLLVQHVLRVAVSYASAHLVWVATNALRERVAGHTLDLDLTFHDAHTPGELIERTDGDVTALSTFVTSFVVQLAGGALTLLGVLVVVLVEDWRIGLGMLGFVVVGALAIGGMRDFAVEPATERRAASARLFGEIEERLNSAEDLRANAGGGYAVRRFQHTLADFMRVSFRAAGATRTIWVVTGAVFAAGGVLSLLAGVILYDTGAISLGTVYLLFRYTVMVQDPLEQISDQQQLAQDAMAGFTRVQDLLDQQPSVRDTGRRTLPDGPLSVELRDVSFAYPTSDPVLRNVDLRLRPGTVLGVVGRTGSGKTTLSRLLLRLADPAEGSVRVGGVDVRQVRLEDLRRRVALVTQDVQLFDATVRDNLTLFDAYSADDRRLLGVLDDLGLGPWYRSLPDGLDTRLGSGGAGVSAGEAQLLAFARVFLRDPALVVLDEATSRLDPVSEARIERAVDKLLAGRTAVLIAHRLSTLDRADEIVVLDRGRIVEHDTRTELMDSAGSRFAGLLATASGKPLS
jgi:ATP-binding cassette, subfamily B, bacterial